MNYMPTNTSNAAYFYAAGLGGPLGLYQKSMQAQSMITVDYAGVLGIPNPPNVGGSVGVANLSFILGLQSLPPLVISNPVLQGQMNILTFLVSGGMGGVKYDVSINALLTNGTQRVDVLDIDIMPPYEDCGCSSCGYNPCQCGPCEGYPTNVQVAMLASSESIFGTNFPQFYVSAKEPTPANLFDKWYNSATGILSDYVSTGVRNYWQPEYSSAGGVISGPVTINNSLTVTGPVNMTLDMGTY